MGDSRRDFLKNSGLVIAGATGFFTAERWLLGADEKMPAKPNPFDFDKRLSDAQADGDTIYAVLRGVAANNDGASKASFTAPSVAGQAQVIGAALAAAGVNAREISYVETHGTATPMGDQIGRAHV